MDSIRNQATLNRVSLAEDKEIFLCQCTTDWKNEKVADIQDISFELRQRSTLF